jgi:hypothetical protein
MMWLRCKFAHLLERMQCPVDHDATEDDTDWDMDDIEELNHRLEEDEQDD